MLGISGNLKDEYRTFNLNKINIEDEGMEDLEKFNSVYKIDNSKCSLFFLFKKIPFYSQIINANEETKIKNNRNTCFKVDLYLRRIIENMNAKKLKSMIMELGALSSNNFIILTKIKSIKSRWKKEQLVILALDIMKNLINIDE